MLKAEPVAIRNHVPCASCTQTADRNGLLVLRLKKTINELHVRAHRGRPGAAPDWWNCKEQVCLDARAATD